jgi:hypothetical protein
MRSAVGACRDPASEFPGGDGWRAGTAMPMSRNPDDDHGKPVFDPAIHDGTGRSVHLRSKPG